MDSTAYLGHLADEQNRIADCLRGDLTAPVRHCGDWTIRDLAQHLGRINLWAVTAVTEGHGRRGTPESPRDAAELVEWFRGTCSALLRTLDVDPATEAWTFHGPGTVGFWQRRLAQETQVHRWDAQDALGAAAPLDPVLAADGVAEVFDTMAPRQQARGAAQPPDVAVLLRATDTGGSWKYGPGEPVAEVAAPAQLLLLLLWRRAAPGDEGLVWRGDGETGAGLLTGGLVP